MTSKNIIGRYAYTAREYVAEFPNMRGGDIFMGAFNAEQVMYNHFGYRTPIPNLYYAGSAAHPGGAISGGSGYITAGIIARDLGVELWWKPWDARAALAACRRRRGHRGRSRSRTGRAKPSTKRAEMVARLILPVIIMGLSSPRKRGAASFPGRW